MRDSKGITYTYAYCKVCGEKSPTEIHTKNQVLTEIAILCKEHKDYLFNRVKFQQSSKWRND